MLYLANPCSAGVRDAMRAGQLGMIATPAQGQAVDPGVAFLLDNGCFGKGYPGDEAWLAWLQGFHPEQRADCLLATAPDVVGDYDATVVRSRPWLEAIREAGYPAALVAQDGMEWSTWDPWDEIDALFIGGSTEWKLGPEAANIAQVALSLGKHVHMGRVNTRKRIRYAHHIGCHSVDGTLLTFGPDKHLAPLLRWMAELEEQPALLAA